MHYLILILIFLLSSCSNNQPDPPKTTTHEISGRDRAAPLYRVRTPTTWKRSDPLPNESLTDTKKSILEFLIQENGEIIRIAIHNFPSQTMEDRIPPAAQVARWKQQFTKLDLASTSVQPQSFSGYAGLMLHATGFLDGEPKTMLAWSMQLAPEHYRTLGHPSFPLESRADFTIKATGPKNFMAKHRSAIYAFAQSFELIEEIPAGI